MPVEIRPVRLRLQLVDIFKICLQLQGDKWLKIISYVTLICKITKKYVKSSIFVCFPLRKRTYDSLKFVTKTGIQPKKVETQLTH